MDVYTDILMFWNKKNISSSGELSAAMSGKIVSLAYHSGKIENDSVTYHDTREIFDHDGITNYTGDLRTLFEIKNAKDAFAFLLEAFDKDLPMNRELLCRLQEELTKNTYDNRRWSIGERPGTFKKHDYVTGREEVGALPEDVPEEIDELLEELKNFSGSDVLTAGAYFHAKLENIHPFADGNGRTGRLAMNYFLLQNGHPPIIIHEENRKSYFLALESWDTEQNLSPLKDFLKEQTIKTWKKNLDRRTSSEKKITNPLPNIRK